MSKTSGAQPIGAASLGQPAQGPAIAPQAASTPIASFGGGTLKVFGDATDNDASIGRNAAGQLLVNGGSVPILGGLSTVANTVLIQAFGQGGHDTLTLDESAGALPKANLFGGAGDDVLTGGSAADSLFGQADDDTLFGRGGADALFGGPGDDTLVGGDANDQMFGEAGNDRLIWNPGDDTDVFEGGADIDTAEVNGGGGAEQFTLTANGTRVRFDRVNPAPFSIDAGTIELFVVNMNGGDDSFSATGNLAALVQLTVDGGSGNDSILGSNGADTLRGGDDDDFVDGQQGADVAFLGAGDDVFQWDPGDGSDTVEGEDGNDRLLFNGSAANESMELLAAGGRTTLTRNIGAIVMDIGTVERFEIHALGGADTLGVRDLTGTGATEVLVDLAATIGGTTGDGQADSVVLDGTAGADGIDVFGSGSSVAVQGLPVDVSIVASEGANDSLVVQAGGDGDTIAATTLPAGVIRLTLDGGDGADTLLGSQGADLLLGGDGADFVLGDNGNDVALLGAGDDVFQWSPGDGSDTVEGQGGSDRMLFFGSNASETIQLVANGGRALFTRDVGSVTMDLDDVETVEFQALGGADTITVGDLSGTDVQTVTLELRGPGGSGDGAADTVTVNATQGADVFGVSGNAGGVTVSGLPAQVRILNPEGANDRLVLNGQGGDDVIDAGGLAAGAVQLTMNGGLGADLFIGSAGNDLVVGGDGNDVALLGGGNDTFVWNPGDDNDVIEGQSGTDTLQFNGANVAELVTFSANGGRVLFTRNVANVLMDLDGTEVLAFNALGGADQIVINHLAGTDATDILVGLGSTLGGSTGDGQADTVVIRTPLPGSVVPVFGPGGTVDVSLPGLHVQITGFETGVDSLVIEAAAAVAVPLIAEIDLGG